MRKKYKIVRPDQRGCRVSFTEHPELIEENTDFLINPDLSRVRNIPPEFWVIKDGREVWPMSGPQQAMHKVKLAHLDAKRTPRTHHRANKIKYLFYGTIIGVSLTLAGLWIWLNYG